MTHSQLLHLMREIRSDIDRCQVAFKRRNLEAEYSRKGRLRALQWVLRRLEAIQPEEPETEPEPQKPQGWFPAMAYAVKGK